jgi:hypothetical protein
MPRVPFVVSFACAALACAACSSDDSAATAPDASVATPGPDASLADTGGGFVLDALPAAVDANDAAPPPAADGGTGDDASPPPPACTTAYPGASCGLDPQCGCSTSQTCDVTDLDGGVTCVTAGNGLPGHACVTTASCRPGLTCFNGACRAYCSTTGDAGCSDAGGPCIQLLASPDAGVPHDDVCEFACDLRNPAACGATGTIAAGCVPDSNGGTDCALAGPVDVNGDCSVHACKPGLTCVQPNVCKAWCRVGHVPDDCPGDAGGCNGFAPPITVHGAEYGVCP